MSVTVVAANYADSTAECTFDIAKKTVNVSISVTDGASYVYGIFEGAVITDVVGSVEKDGYDSISDADFKVLYKTVSGDAESDQYSVNVGNYVVSVVLENQNNYQLESDEGYPTSVGYSITRKPIAITINDSSVFYGDALPKYTLADNVTVPEDSFEYGDGITSIGLPKAFVSDYTQGADKGTYHIYLNGYKNDNDTAVIELANYTVTVERGKLTVGARSITVSFDIPTGAVYDGNEHVISGVEFKNLYSGSDGEVAPGVVITYSGGYNNDTSPVNAGAYTYTISITNGNYVLTGITDGALSDNGIVTGTFEIDRREVTVDWSDQERFEYNGNDQKTSVTAVYKNAAGIDVSLSVSVTGDEFKDYKEDAYTFTASLSTDLEKNNYYFLVDGSRVTEVSKGFYIDPADYTLTIDDDSVTYGEEYTGYGNSISQLIGDDTLESIGFFAEYEYGSDYALGDGVNTYNLYLTKDGAALEDGATFIFGNYKFTLDYGALTVTAREITVSYTVSSDIEYSGSAYEISNIAFSGLYSDVNPDEYVTYTALSQNVLVEGKAVDQGTYGFEIIVNNDNYKLTGTYSGEFVIKPKSVDVQWNHNDSYTYTGSSQAGTVSASYTNVESSPVTLDIKFTVDEAERVFLAADTYTVTAGFVPGDNEKGNYELSDSELSGSEITLVIDRFTITSVTWYRNGESISDGTEIVYDGYDQRSDITVKFTGPDSDHSLTFEITAGSDAAKFEDVNEYMFTALIGEYSGNYKFADDIDADIVLKIVEAELTEVTLPVSWTFTYDGASHSVVENQTVSAVGVGEDGDAAWTYSLTGDGEYSAELTVKDVPSGGVYTVYYKAELANHKTETGSFTVTVKARSLTLYATAITQYGTVLPTGDDSFIYTGEATEGKVLVSASGFAPDEGFDDLTKSGIKYESTYDASEYDGIGSMYTITLTGGFTSSNYDIFYESGVVTVTPREVTVTLVQSTGHTYGNSAVDLSDADEISDIAVLYETVENGFGHTLTDIVYYFSVSDSGEILELTTSGRDLNNVGEYDIVLVEGAYNENYSISLQAGAGKYVIEQRPIGISFTNTSVTYNGREQSITVAINDADIVSAENLTFTVKYTGRDTGTSFTLTSDNGGESWEGTSPVNADTYVVTVEVTSTGSNYLATNGSAEFTIARRSITINIADQSSEYDGNIPSAQSVFGENWTIVTGKFVNGDEQHISLYIEDAAKNADEYRIWFDFGNEDGVEDNYDISAVAGTYTIEKVDLTITADSKTLTYGDPVPEYSLTYDGLVDDIGDVDFSVTPSATSDYNLSSLDTRKVGTYQIVFTAEEITSTNYNITLVEGTLTVETRAITIDADDRRLTYGDISEDYLDSEYELSDSRNDWDTTKGNILDGDDLGIILSVDGSDAGYAVGTYSIKYTAGNAEVAENYDITYEEATLKIEKKTLTVTADGFEIQYGTVLTSDRYSYTLSGFVYRENADNAGISGSVTFTNSGYDVTSDAGSIFTITPDGDLNSGNYDFEYVAASGNITVIKREITLSFNEPEYMLDGVVYSKIYGMYDSEITAASAYVNAAINGTGGLVNDDTASDYDDGSAVRLVYRYYGTAYDDTSFDGETLPDKAGSYTVSVTIESKNYTLSEPAEKTYRILKMRLTTPEWDPSAVSAEEADSVSPTLSYGTLTGYGDKTYDNTSAAYAIYSSVGGDGAYNVSHDESLRVITMSATATGSYWVILSLVDSDNFVWSTATGSDTPQVTISWTISQYTDNEIEITGAATSGGIQFTVESVEGKYWFVTDDPDYVRYFTDSAVDLIVSAHSTYGSDTIYFEYYYAGGERFGSAPVDAGTYYVIAVVEGTGIYVGARSAPVYFTISKALVEKPDAPSYEDFVYSGSELTYEIAESEYYTVTGNTGTGAGTYYATVKLVDANNYEWAVDGESTGSSAALPYEWKIAKKVLTAPSDPASGTYNHGSAVSSSLTGVDYDYDTMRITGVSATGSNVGSISVSGGEYLITAVNADTYTITVKLRDSGNYEWADAEGDTITLTWIVNKYVVAAPSAGDPTSISYDGSQHSYLDYYPAFADSDDSAYYYLDGNLYATDAGSYGFTAVLRDSANYEWKSDSAEFVWYITKAADNEITGLSDSYEWTFGDDPEGLAAEAKYGSVTFEYYDAEGGATDPFTDRTAAGTYTVKAVVTGTDNYDGCEVEITVVIAQRTVSVTWSVDGSLVYDGSDLSGSVTAGYYDIDGGFRTLGFDINDDFIDAGSYLFTVSQLTEGNYVLDEETLSRTFEIAPLSVTVKVTVSAESMPYGGEVPEAGWTYGDGGKFADRDNINVTVSEPVTRLSGTGTYTVTASASGTLSNYDITYESATIEVTARRITVTALPTGSTYGDNLVNLTSAYYDVESGEADGLGIVNGDVNVVTLYVGNANGSRTDAGTYDIQYLLNNANYEVVDFVSAVYTVSAREVSVVWSTPTSDAMTYNGVNKFIHVSAYYVDIDGEEIPLEVTPTDMTDAGTYSLTASFAEADPNYTLTGATETYTVLAKRIYVTIINNSHVYGDVETATASSDGIIENDADSTGLLLVYTGTAYNGTVYDGTIGDGWTLGVEYTVNEYGNVVPLYAGEYTITVYAVSMDDMASDGNYIIASGATGSFYVAKAAVSAPAAGDDGVSLSAVYDGTTLTATIPESELYRVSENEGGVSVGIYRVVLTLTDSDNYMWEGVTASDITLGFSVTKAANSVSDVEITSEFEYGASPDPSASSVFGTVVYRYYVKSGDTYTEIAEPPAAGTYYVRAEVAGTSDFDGCVSDYAEFTITKKSVAKPVITSGAVYNGETQTVTVSGFDPSVMTVTGAGAVYTIENGVLTITATESGTYSFGIALRDSDNYEWADGTTDTVTLDWTIEQGEQNLVWLIAVLGTVVFAELLAAIIRGVSGRKKNGNGSDGGNGGDDSGNDGDVGGNGNGPEESGEGGGGTAVAAEDRGNEAFAFLPMICASTFVPAGQMAAIIALASAAVVMGVIDVVVFVRKRKKKGQDEEAAPEETPQEEPSEAAYAEEPAPDISAEEPAAPEIAAAVIGAESPADEEPARTEPAAEAPSEELPPEEIPAVVTAETAVQPPEEEDAEQDDDDNDFDVEIIECVEVLPDEPAENETADVAAVAVPVRRKIVVRYKFSFRAKLIQAPRELQARFGEFADEARAYKKVKFTVSWKQVRIYSGRNTLALVLFKGRKICVAFALDPAEYAESKYGGIDVSSVKRFAKTPYLLKLTSARKTRYAKELFAAVAAKYGLEKGSVTKTDFYLPFRTTEELIKVNLVKLLSSGDITGDAEVVKADIADLIRDKITLAEAGISLSDEVAAEYMETADDMAAVRKPVSRGRRAIINIDTLAQNFAAEDVVTLDALKEKKLVPSGAGSLKVLARGLLDKPLTVEADDFSIDAVKMILLTGGRPVKI